MMLAKIFTVLLIVVSSASAQVARPLGCNTKITVTGVTASQPVTGNLAHLYDGVVNNPWDRVEVINFPTNLDFSLEPAPGFGAQNNSQFVCSVSYHTEWWAQAPNGGEISFSTDNGATFTSQTTYTGAFSGVYGPTYTPEAFNTFITSGLANEVRIRVDGTYSSVARIRECTFYTWD